MKHKPSTKSELQVLHDTTLKNEQVMLENRVFLSSLLIDLTDTQNRERNMNMIMPFTRAQSNLTAEEEEERKHIRRSWGKPEQWYPPDDSTVSLSPPPQKTHLPLQALCGGPERVWRSRNTAILQIDDHQFPSMSSPVASAPTSTATGVHIKH